MKEENYTRAWLILIAITLALAFAFQGSRGLWRADEGRYVRCAYEMLKTGDWVTPQINYQPHFTKPPMTYWALAASFGAPVIEPGGNAARSASSASQPARRRPCTVETR